jgi:L-seryl-tRNA(Ser) seleniumtransferase
VIDDVGSGALVDFHQFSLGGEPLPAESVRAGADLVLFSGDKLLGGPQCGIAVGTRQAIDRMSSHPLARPLRVDKITLAALRATLAIYRQPDRVNEAIPLLSLLATSLENLRHRAEKMALQLRALDCMESAEPLADETYLGGGSIPGQRLGTWCVALMPRSISVTTLAQRLRTGWPAVCGRVAKDRLLLDLRAVRPQEDGLIVQAVEQLRAEPTPSAP